MFFIEGRQGRGKAFLVKAISSTLRSLGEIVLIVGSTALCATAYDRGRTAHHMFGIPVTDDDVNLISNIHPHSPRADLIRHTSLIIWDELQTMNKAGWECVDNVCRLICNRPQSPFGGIPFIGLGDFHQIGPVVSGAGRIATLEASVKSSSLWEKMDIFTLTTPVRSFGDPEFTQFVDSIGEDTSGNRQQLQMLAKTTNIDHAAEFLFPQASLADPDTCLQRVFLSPRNMFVEEFNDKILEKLPGEYASYFSSDSVVEAEHLQLHGPEETPEYLALLTHPGVPPHRLDLKVNCVCAIQRNLSVEKGLVRNARVRITALRRRFVEVQILNTFETHCIPRITFSFNPGKSSWTVHRKQFPLRLAYATTFNSCQRLTLARTVLDLRTNPFAHGQLYTALSRVRNHRDTICLFAESVDKKDCANIVYDNLLL